MPPSSRIIYPLKPKPRRPFPKRFLLTLGVLALLAVLLGGSWYTANLPYLRVEKIEIKGARLIPASAVEQAVAESIGGVFLPALPRNNFFLISGSRLAEDLGKKFPQVSEIVINKSFPDKLVITIRERTLWGVYCERLAPSRLRQGFGGQAQPRSPCFYLDANGAAYEVLAEFEGWLLPIIYSPEPASLGKEAVLPAMLKFYGQADTALEAVSGHILFMSISTTTPDDARLGLAENWGLWVTATRPVSEWLEVLKAVLEKDIGERRPELDYIDLRFGNKVFYKFR